MPGLRVHIYIDRRLFGKSYWRIHRKMDDPVKILGKRHRALYHDPTTATAIARSLYPFDPDAACAAIYHIRFDYMCSLKPRLKKTLETLAGVHRKQRRRRIGMRARRKRNDFREKLMTEMTKRIRKKILTG